MSSLASHRTLAGSTFFQRTVWALTNTMRRSGYGAHEDTGLRVFFRRPVNAGTCRVIRGSSWDSAISTRWCKTSGTNWDTHTQRNENRGFRIVYRGKL
jgi:formylglycine-generating enzyme required for sulfatase activity